MRFLKSIRGQLILIILLCYLIPTLLLGQYMGGVFFADLREKTETALSSSVEHAGTLTLQRVRRAVDLAKDATYDGELADVHTRYQAGSMNPAEFLRLSRNYIERKYSREELFTFALFIPRTQPDMAAYNRAGYEAAMTWLRLFGDQMETLAQELDTRCLFMEAEGQMYLVRSLMDLKLERFGMLVLGVNRELLLGDAQELAGLWDGTVAWKLGRSGSTGLPWAQLPSGLSEASDEGWITYAVRESDRDYDFALLLSVSRDRLYGEIVAFRRLMTWLFLLLAPILAAILWYLHRRIIKPISLLSQASHRIEAGELGVTVPMRGNDELGRLGSAFSGMSLRIQALIDKTYKEEIALRDAKIQAMQSRINPHFINNALETLNWQARLEGSESVSGMVESLSVLLNAGMARGNRRMVTLDEEVEVARAYFHFVGLRFGERLKVSMELADGSMRAIVPLLTIQPLLENAVEHGIEPAGGGEIILRSIQAGSFLRLTVINSGKAPTEEGWQRIRQSLNGDNHHGQHIGLANISTRLRLIYGERAAIHVEADEQGRTVVRLDIPQSEEGDEACGVY
ncbi:MAG: sensor histidine kinase [Clostridiales bacterium]|nr:sensor histidine kinase [Clostridiales bacterium]